MDPVLRTLYIENNKPHMLAENVHPEINISKPDLFKKLIHDVIYPDKHSDMQRYYDITLDFLKGQSHRKIDKISVNANANIHMHKLLFLDLCFDVPRSVPDHLSAPMDTGGKNSLLHEHVSALIDTGCERSLLHESVAKKLRISYEPLSLTLCTASGNDKQAVVGKCHLQFITHDHLGRDLLCCNDFVVTKKLNNLQAILGVDFLFKNDRTIAINNYFMQLNYGDIQFKVPVAPKRLLGGKCRKNAVEYIDITCGDCVDVSVNINSHHISVKNLFLVDCENDSSIDKVISNNETVKKHVCRISEFHAHEFPHSEFHKHEFHDREFPHSELCEQKFHKHKFPDSKPKKQKSHNYATKFHEFPRSKFHENAPEFHEPESSRDSFHEFCNHAFHNRFSHDEGSLLTLCPFTSNNDVKECHVMTSSIKNIYEKETLPDADLFFYDDQEIKFNSINHTFNIDDGDFSDCPSTWLTKVKLLLHEFHDSYSKTELDVSITDVYIADLITEPSKKIIQKCKRLPLDRFKIGLKALTDLEKLGIVSKSNSEWRSNLIMTPPPNITNKLHSISISSAQNKKQQLFRLSVDFKELNKILRVPRDCHFPTLDDFLKIMSNKFVVNLDIASSLVIPISSKHRYKTSFWINELSFEYNVLTTGLCSFPFHLQKCLDKIFSEDAYLIHIKKLSANEQALLPGSFKKIIATYFESVFVFAADYETLFVSFKLVLFVLRAARVKFSIKKSKFFTQNISVLGYAFNTKDAVLTMDKVKASAILNMKKPTSVQELQSRLSSFHYQSVFLPYLKHISYPLQIVLKKNVFSWTEVEELSWQSLKELSALDLRLTVPNEKDNLLLCTDASKIAASANLFCEKDGKLELVAVNSKFFSSNDLHKCSYVLESIALAYGLKIYSAYILNCKGTVKLFTDAKSLIYAKRNAKHSKLLNSAITYINNFVSLANIEIYHIPGQINLLADIMSRAISDNLQCGLTKQHPISKQWAQQIPPLQKNFAVTKDALFKFLVEPLKPESQDIHNRDQKRLIEPKTFQQGYTESLLITPEHRYYCGLKMLEKYNNEYLDSWASTNVSKKDEYCDYLSNAKLLLDRERKKYLFDKLQGVIGKLYKSSTDKSLKRRISANLKEVAIGFIKSRNKPLNRVTAENLNYSVKELSKYISGTEKLALERRANNEVKNNILSANNVCLKNEKGPTVLFQLSPKVSFKPSICEFSNGWDLPLQEDIVLKPMECKKIDLGVKIVLPTGFSALLLKKDSAGLKYVHVNLGLLDIGLHNYTQAVLQNVADEHVFLRANTPIAQLLVLKGKIPEFEIGWKELKERESSLKSADTSSDEIIRADHCKVIVQKLSKLESVANSAIDLVNPCSVTLSNMHISLLGESSAKASELSDLLEFERSFFPTCNYILKKLPTIECFNANFLNDEIDEFDNELSDTSDASKTLPPLSQKEIDSMLIGDLCENKKLSLDLFQQMQDEDVTIFKIKQNLIENVNAYKYFVLRNNVVCRQYSIKHDNKFFLGVYIPTRILQAVVIYVHKYFNHPSITQTFKQFRNMHFHPLAKKAVQKVCAACTICAKTRNAVSEKLTIGLNRSLDPQQPRERFQKPDPKPDPLTVPGNHESSFGKIDLKKNRSGLVYSININNINPNHTTDVAGCSVSRFTMGNPRPHRVKKVSCLKRIFNNERLGIPKIPDVVPHYDMNDLKAMSAKSLKRIVKFKEKIVHSSFKNGVNCIVKMFLKPDTSHRKVKFSHLTVYYC